MATMGKRPIIEDIRANIQREMDRLGLKSKPLSKGAGLSESAIRDLMRKVDDPRIGTLLALSEALNVPTSILLGEMVPVVGTVGLFGEVTMLPQGPDAELQFVPRPPSREAGLVAYRIVGFGTLPTYRNGDLIYAAECDRHYELGCCEGVECLVHVEGIGTYLRLVHGGAKGEPARLSWFSQPDLIAEKLAWVSPVLFVMRATGVDAMRKNGQVGEIPTF